MLLAVALALAAGCSRVTELIGYVRGDGGPADVGVPGSPDVGSLPVACAPDPAPPAVAPPAWNCGERCLRDDDVPADFAALFAGPVDPAAASRPALVYPLAGSVHPLNLADMTLQWRIQSGDARRYLFRLRIARVGAPSTSVDLLVPCRRPPAVPADPPQEACVYAVPRRVWASIAASAAGDEVDITIDASEPGRSQAAPVRIAFSPAAVDGGLHYFSTKRRGIERHVLGARGAVPLVQPGGPGLDGRFDCAGCHSVSRDGGTIAFAATYAGYLTVGNTVDPARRSITPPEPPVPDAIAPALTRDGRYVLGRRGDGTVDVRETATGRVLVEADAATLGGRLHFPEWSPDGSEVVATRVDAEQSPFSARDGVIVVVPFDGVRLGVPRVVASAPTAELHMHPSWSPDGRLIVFVSAPLGTESLRNPRTRLRLVARTGGPIHELTSATQVIGASSTAPRFAPFAQAGCNLTFIAFSSRIDYGFLRRNSVEANGGWPQLWLAAVDLRKLGSTDPSSAPVWLPFQDLSDGNRLPSWSERVPCANDAACGDGAVCAQGQCAARPD